MAPNIRKRPRPSAAASEAVCVPTAMGHNRTHNLRLRIEYFPTKCLKRPLRETRKHSKKQVEQIIASMRRFGNIDPLVVDNDNRIFCGVGRYLAAQMIGLPEVPVIRADHLTADELRAYALAENKLAEGGEWDRPMLKLELGDLSNLDDLELGLTGFAGAELDAILLDEPSAEGGGGEEEIAAPLEDPPITKLGDLYQIGEHLLICGNAREPSTYVQLMGSTKAHMAFGDLPYNVKIAGNVSGLGKKKHGEFVEGSGELSRAGFIDFMSSIFSNLVAYSVDGAIHFQCMDWRSQLEMVTAGEAHYSELKNLLVWSKTNAGMGTFYRSQHELIYAWKVGSAPHQNHFGLGETGRWRSNVLVYPGANVFRKGRDEDLEAHSTVKPTALVADLIQDVSTIGDIVLDPTAGSGTTILACERTRRRARCIELDPKYVDVAIRRAKSRLGLDAVHVATGLTFDELAEQRSISMGNIEPTETGDLLEEDAA